MKARVLTGIDHSADTTIGELPMADYNRVIHPRFYSYMHHNKKEFTHILYSKINIMLT
jgi:hypothetical protein